MQLLERYLAAVKFWLPKNHRDDIVAELEANRRAEIDDRAAALGRPLTEEEIATLLQQHGSPIQVAAQYAQETRTVSFGRQLIGPIMFPFYWTAVKVTLVLLLIPGVVPALVLGVHAHGHAIEEIAKAVTRVAWLSLPVLLFVTLVFAALDFGLRRFRVLEGRAWDPRRLPSPAGQAKQVRRSSSIAGIIIQSLFIFWWWNHGGIPYLVLSDAGARIHFAPVLASLYLPVLVIAFIHLAQHWINLVEPDWRWLPPATGVVTSLIALIILYPVLGHSPLISISEAGGLPLAPEQTEAIQRLIAVAFLSLWFGILAVGGIYAWRLVWILWQEMPRHSSGATKDGMAQI